jgi:hypothetical protein
MLSDWVIILAVIELFSFVILGLGIATAIPEEEIVPQGSRYQTVG